LKHVCNSEIILKEPSSYGSTEACFQELEHGAIRHFPIINIICKRKTPILNFPKKSINYYV